MSTRTRIRAGQVIAFQQGRHCLLEDGEVVLEGDRIVHVGRAFAGEVDQEIDAQRQLLTPGLINTHTHVTTPPAAACARTAAIRSSTCPGCTSTSQSPGTCRRKTPRSAPKPP
jgi:cytosine/adenosine deaminase-related metal-dependent hydrolase